MGEPTETRDPLRADCITRMARLVHPEEFPRPLECMPPEVMADAMAPGMLDALVSGRIDIPSFRASFHALCPVLECGPTGLPRVALAMSAIGESPAAFMTTGLLTEPLYPGQGPLTDRRIWAAAATCTYLEDGRSLRFDPRVLAQRAMLLPPIAGRRPVNSVVDPERLLATPELSYEFFVRALGSLRSKDRLAKCLAICLRTRAHGAQSRPPQMEFQQLASSLLSSPLGFQRVLQIECEAMVACRRLSPPEADGIRDGVRRLLLEIG